MKLPIQPLLPALLLTAPVLAQTTIHVPGDVATIAAAVATAASGDTVLVDPGTYFENSIDTNGKAIRIASTGGPGVTTIDAQFVDRHFFIGSGEGPGTILEGFRLYRGHTVGNGGAILVLNSSPTIRNCVMDTGRAGTGGGIRVIGGAPLIEDCHILACGADFDGGGYYGQASNATLRRCTIELCFSGKGENGSVSGAGGVSGYEGGGAYIFFGDNTVFESCRFLGNRTGNGGNGARGANGANGSVGVSPKNGGKGGNGGFGGYGGGVYVESGDPLFVNTYFNNNRTGNGGTGGRGGDGGDGIAFQDGADGGRGGNAGSGGRGGAVYVSTGSPRFVNCTVVLNQLGGPGSRGSGGSGGSGGLGASNGSPGSPGSTGSNGIYGGFFDADGTVVQNSIVWFNASSQVSGALVDFSNVQGGYAGTGNIALDPLLSGESLSASSPCIDAGNAVLVPAGITTDAEGDPRAFEDPLVANATSGAPVDMGWDEFVQPFLVPISCAPAGTLLASGTPQPGATLAFEVVNDPACVGPRAELLQAGLLIGTVDAANPCGTSTAAGSLMLDPARPLKILWGGAGETVLELGLPGSPSLVGVSFGVQGLFVSPRLVTPSAGCPASGGMLLDAFHVVVGP